MNKYIDAFEMTARLHIKRDGIEDVLALLRKSDFYTAPASTRFHGSKENGLVEHSLNVFNVLYNDLPTTDLDSESMAIVALFHDICKIGFYKVSTRNTKDETGKWIQVPYYEVEDMFPVGHSEKSVIMLMEKMKLTPDEIYAIRGHMGGFDKQQDVVSGCFSKSKLAVMLHSADLIATYVCENK